IDIVVDPADNETLYKDRDPQLTVVGKILEDYQYALDNVRANDTKLQVHKYLVGGLMSRNMLYHATWLKYHGTTVGSTSQPVADADLKKFFEGAINGAKVVMESGKYSIGNTYNALFTTDDISTNSEIIFYKEYTTGVSCNALMAYNAGETQNLGGATIDAIESYLCLDGLPIGQSSSYQGATDPSIRNAFVDRDPRIYDTFVDSLRIYSSGLHSAASPTGFASKKFLNEEWRVAKSPYVTGLLSPADAPVIRYAEVLLNYAEARYEISKTGGDAFTQADLDKSINEIRKRTLKKWGETPAVERKLPPVTLSGSNLSVNGTVINDPARDTTVDPILWEIRRERRAELIMEGRRSDDLNRWAKFDYLNSTTDGTRLSKTILGAWINKTDYPGISTAVVLYEPGNTAGTATQGYINYYHRNAATWRTFTKGELNSERNYLRAVPSGQITAYKDKGYTLTQNPGW
ncbi:MAG: RagB/SusD family nutrient uptake outer membrane protein, partial [Mediterranea sp.]|nr:RagB/SusD family nutrient uptake outer membrane protein [Mediterranea sp.]